MKGKQRKTMANQSPSRRRQHQGVLDHNQARTFRHDQSPRDHHPLIKATREDLRPIFHPALKLDPPSLLPPHPVGEVGACLVAQMIGRTVDLIVQRKLDLDLETNHPLGIVAAVELLPVLEAGVDRTAMIVLSSDLSSVLGWTAVVDVMMDGLGLAEILRRSTHDLTSPVIAMSPAAGQSKPYTPTE